MISLCVFYVGVFVSKLDYFLVYACCIVVSLACYMFVGRVLLCCFACCCVFVVLMCWRVVLGARVLYVLLFDVLVLRFKLGVDVLLV